MKITIMKALATVSACALMAGMPISAFAAENGALPTATENVVESIVDETNSDAGVAPYSYYDPESFTFNERNVGNTRWYDNGHMAAEIQASSDITGLKMHVVAHIVGKGSVSWDVPVDGKVHKKDWISLGTSSGRNVYFEYTCAQNTSARITVHNKSYSW